MLLRFRALILFALVLSPCAVVFSNAASAAIFGQDDRRILRSSDYPWRAIGRVLSDGGSCTGSLIGDDLVLTARHCVMKQNLVFENLRFVADSDGVGELSSRATWVTAGNEDWALFRLHSPIGKKLGSFGIRIMDYSRTDDKKGSLLVAAFSGDRSGMTAHYNCHPEALLSPSRLGTSCDFASGADGGPVLSMFPENNRAQILAVNIGVLSHEVGIPYSHAKANVAVVASQFAGTASSVTLENMGVERLTYIQLCNKSGRGDIKAAIAYNRNGWISQGWHLVKSNTCQEVPIRVDGPYNGAVFVYGSTLDGRAVWGSGTYSFCIHDSSDFEYTDVYACNADRESRVRFSDGYTVKKGDLNFYYFK